MSDETRLLHAGKLSGDLVHTVGPPIQKGSTVLLPNAAALYDDDHYITYGRAGLSAQQALRSALAELEGAADVALYPSGIAAISGPLLALLKAGDRILVPDTVYKPVRRFCDNVLKRFGVAIAYYDPRLPPEQLVGEAPADTRMILLESPGSLSFEMQDIPRIAELAKARGVLTLADNTWGAGYLFKPLAHGVDVSVQALTKYAGGHSDVFMGSAAAANPRLAKILTESVNHLGWAVSGDEAYAMLKGLRTLPVRMQRHGESGLAVAEWLKARPEVAEVFHPGLPGARGHDIWKREYSGACGLFAFALKPAPQAAVDAFLDALELFGLGFSWGGFESLAIWCDPQFKVRSFCTEYGGPMIRLHIGLEDLADITADLERGFAAYRSAAS